VELEIAPEAHQLRGAGHGNMETLHLFATEEQSKQWLEPLLKANPQRLLHDRPPLAAATPATSNLDRARTVPTRDSRPEWWTSGRGGSALQDPES